MFTGWLLCELRVTSGGVGANAMSSDVYDPSDGPTCGDGSASGGAPCIAIHSDIRVVNARLKEMKPSVGVTVFIQCTYGSCSLTYSVHA